MRKLMGTMIVGGLFFAGCAAKQAAPPPLPPPPPPQVTSDTKSTPGRVEKVETITVTAVVTHIDQKQRLVTLKGPDGASQTVHVGDDVRNLAQVKKGDHVVVSYLESIVFQLHKKGKAKPGAEAVEGAGRAEPGQMPGAVGARAVTVVATVMKVDKKAPSITLKGPKGKTMTLPVKDASKLDPVKVGDLIEITYTEAMAVAVEKAP